MVILDIKSAFDSVWHNGLIYKLKGLNFPEELIKIIQNFVYDRYFSVHISTTTYQKIRLTAGCPISNWLWKI